MRFVFVVVIGLWAAAAAALDQAESSGTRLPMLQQARQIEYLDSISVGASLTGVVQEVGAGGSASGSTETRSNYRGDISATFPDLGLGRADGSFFAHLRFGRGPGIALRPTYTSTANSLAFSPEDGRSDGYAILAQAWYQLKLPLESGDEHLHFTVGKIDPFVFFDQNAAADDESAKFMNNAFVHNPLLDSGGDARTDVHGFVRGAVFQYANERREGAEWMASVGVFGAHAGAYLGGLRADPFAIAQFETAAQFGALPGHYRAYVWRNLRGQGYDGTYHPHTGAGVSIDQKVTDALTLFGRFGRHMSGKVIFNRAVTIGAELEGSGWHRPDDSLGLAYGDLGTSRDYQTESAVSGCRASGHEHQMELYYRYKHSANVELSPDLQWISRPAGNGAAAAIKVVGLRVKLGF